MWCGRIINGATATSWPVTKLKTRRNTLLQTTKASSIALHSVTLNYDHNVEQLKYKSTRFLHE